VLLGLLGRELTQGWDAAPFQPTQPIAGCTYFPETGHNLCGGFRAYWERFGGVAIYGFPISEEFQEVNPDTGLVYTVQYFERQRFEWHPGEWPERYDIVLGRLGVQLVGPLPIPEFPCPVGNESFCRFVHTIDTILESRDTERFLDYVVFEPYTCWGDEGWTVPFRHVTVNPAAWSPATGQVC
jgi:hypothetical protein